MYASGMSVLQSIRIGEGLLGNRAVEEAARTAAKRIAEGASISEGFEQAGLFPPLVLRMLRVGESTGALDTALSNIGYFYERDVRDAAERVQGLAGPATTLVLGALLLWVVVSVMGPIYEMVAGISCATTRILSERTDSLRKKIRTEFLRIFLLREIPAASAVPDNGRRVVQGFHS